MKTDNVVEIRKLTKRFKDVTAVNDVSLSIKRDEIFGLLGPNGAGKTTTISILSTLIKPTSGNAIVNGYDILQNPGKIRASIGLVFQETVLDLDLSAKDNLDFHARIYHLPKEIRQKRIKEVLALVGLTEHANKRVETFSGGMKRRLETARGLLHQPAILFLDEPTLGLDPQTRRHIWDYILNMKRQGKITVLLTTHYMEEADYLCDRIAIIDNGKIVISGKPGELKQKLKGDVVSLKVDKITPIIIKNLRSIKGVSEVKSSGTEARIITTKAEEKLQKIVEAVKKSKAEIQAISVHKPSLEDVFLYYTGKEMRE